MMVRLNPELDLVEVDDDEGTMTIRNKRTDEVVTLDFHPEGDWIVASTNNLSELSFWPLEARTPIVRGGYDTSAQRPVAFTPDGRLIARGSLAVTVRLWDLATAKQIASFEGNRNPVTSVAFSPDGRHIASGSLDDTVRLCQVSDGSLLNTSGRG